MEFSGTSFSGESCSCFQTVWKKEKGEANCFPFFFGSCYGFARLFGCSLFIEFLQDSLGDVEFFIGGE